MPIENFVDEQVRGEDGSIRAAPDDLIGHWYVIAASSSVIALSKPGRSAQIMVAALRLNKQRSLLHYRFYGRDLLFAGHVVEEHCAASSYTWKGRLWGVFTPRSHWVIARSEDGDTVSMRNAGAISMRSGLVVLSRISVEVESARANLAGNMRTLGLLGESGRDLILMPPPSADQIDAVRARWARMGEAPLLR